MKKIKCPKCGSTKIKNFLEIKGKNAKLKCGKCNEIYWTYI